MKILSWFTYLAATAVVALLAVYLTLAALSLVRANHNLGRVAVQFEAVRDNTLGLSAALDSLNGASGALYDKLAAVDRNLAGIIRLLKS